jgi:GxxExxY protein
MAPRELLEQQLTHSIIGAFFDAYNALGFGFLESVYIMALERELTGRGHQVGREVWVPVFYKGQPLCKQRCDMIVDEKVIVETKSTFELPDSASRQVYNYLRATNLEVGLLFHFGPKPRFFRVIYRNALREVDAKTPSETGSPPEHRNGHPERRV